MRGFSNLHRDYLVEIYQATIIETNHKKKSVSSAELAQRMLTSQSSVNRIVDRLDTLDLIEYERYIGVKLNKNGQHEAQEILRKQYIIESFLITVLSFEWHEVYQEARQMRHHVSDTVLSRMLQIMEYPLFSPFGEPVDSSNSNKVDDIILTEADIASSYMIKRVLTRQPDRLQYLSALNLTIGTEFQLLHKAPFDGPIQIQLKHEYRILGFELSKMITVVRID